MTIKDENYQTQLTFQKGKKKKRPSVVTIKKNGYLCVHIFSESYSHGAFKCIASVSRRLAALQENSVILVSV